MVEEGLAAGTVEDEEVVVDMVRNAARRSEGAMRDVSILGVAVLV